MFTVEHSDDETVEFFQAGVLLGLLVGEGTFGGDGRQPHVVLRMHVRHESLFLWLKARFPYARLYGPYHHSGRSYYQFGFASKRRPAATLPKKSVACLQSPEAAFSPWVATHDERAGIKPPSDVEQH